MRKHNVSDSGCVTILRWGKGDICLSSPLERANLIYSLPSLEDENKPSFGTVAFSNILNSERWMKSRNPVILRILND
jgi:hypothetical protein